MLRLFSDFTMNQAFTERVTLIVNRFCEGLLKPTKISCNISFQFSNKCLILCAVPKASNLFFRTAASSKCYSTLVSFFSIIFLGYLGENKDKK